METHHRSIASTAVVVMILTGLGFILGLAVQILVAKYFGVGAEIDTFVVAAMVPEFIFGVSNAVFLTSFMILFAEYQRAHGIEAGKKYLQRMFTVVVLSAIIVAAAVAIFAPWIAQVVAPGFLEEQLASTILLIQVLSIAALFFVISSFTTAILYHENKFISAKLLRVIISVGVIITVVMFGKKIGITSLAVGTALGVAVAVIIQYLALNKKGYSFSFLFWEKDEVKEVLVFSSPLVITSLFFYASKAIMNMIASTTGTGSIAILNYGFLLVNVPVLFFSESLGTVLFPRFTKDAANNGGDNVRESLLKAIHVLLFMMLPVMIVFMIFNKEIVYYLFERGAFTADATKAVSDILFIFTIGLIPLSLMALVGSTLSAVKKVKERMYIFFSLLLLNVLFSLLLVPFFSYKGIAIAISMGYWIVVTWGMWYLLKTLKFSEYKKNFMEVLKLIFVSAISAGVVLFLHLEVIRQESIVEGSLMHVSLLLGVVSLFMGVYCLLMNGMKAESWEIIMQAVRRKDGN